MLIAILRGTPVQIWLLLAVLIALGLTQSRPREVGVARTTVLPSVLLVLSFYAVVASFGLSAAPVAAWLAGFAAALALAPRLLPSTGAVWSAAAKRMRLPGSWLPMVLIVGLFLVRYAAGVSLALHPQWAASADFFLPFSFAYGVFSGIFAARALEILRIRRRVEA